MLIKEDTTLEEAWRDLGHELHRGASDRKSGLHQFVLATQAPEGPDACYVVLRSVSQRFHLECYTDYRSAKVQHLKTNSQVCGVFYHPRQRFQLRVYAETQVHRQNATAEQRWKRVPQGGRRAYNSAISPGAAIGKPSEGQHWPDIDDPWNFAVLDLIPHRWDLLQLNNDAQRRVIFTSKKEGWQGQWVAP